MIVNVESKNSVILSNKLRDELLTWVNTMLKSKFTKVEELCTGAAYCQLLHSMYPHTISIRRVKFVTNLEHECFENFKILQKAFQKLNITKTVPVARLCKGKYQDNLEFLAWFRQFYEANAPTTRYDPVAARNGMPMKYGPVEVRRIYEKRAKDALKTKVSICRMKAAISDNVFENEENSTMSNALQKCSRSQLSRSATRTLIKYKSNKPKKQSISAGNSLRDIDTADGSPRSASQDSSIDYLEAPHRFRRSSTRTIIKYNKEFEKEVSSTPIINTQCSYAVVKQSSSVKPRMSGGGGGETDRETELYVLQKHLKELERKLDQKNRESCEKELEVIKLQNEINEMRNELRETRQDRDTYFDKMHRVAVCCRNAQFKADIVVPIATILEIFLDEGKPKNVEKTCK